MNVGDIPAAFRQKKIEADAGYYTVGNNRLPLGI